MDYNKISILKIRFIVFLFSLLFGWQINVLSQGIIIDHTCTNITVIPESAIIQAKASLHIGYGHTSHGSQLTTGMTGLVHLPIMAVLGFHFLTIFLHGIMEEQTVHLI